MIILLHLLSFVFVVVLYLLLVSFFFFFVYFFFFEAEDGIRDLVRSRGLGDVYKRQTQARASTAPAAPRRCPVIDFVLLILRLYACSPNTFCIADISATSPKGVDVPCTFISVSYTHLTLPTSDLV